MADDLLSILSDPKKRAAMERRFWPKVDRSGGPDACWPWTAWITKAGYGRFRIGGGGSSKPPSHRIALALSIGAEKLAGLFALHRCNNPPCCNPEHLYPGDHDTNMADRLKAGNYKQPGTKNPGAKLTEAQAIEIFLSQERASHFVQRWNISAGAVYLIRARQTWTHVTNSLSAEPKRRFGNSKPNRVTDK